MHFSYNHTRYYSSGLSQPTRCFTDHTQTLLCSLSLAVPVPSHGKEGSGLVCSVSPSCTGLPKPGATNQNAPRVISNICADYVKEIIQIATQQ